MKVCLKCSGRKAIREDGEPEGGTPGYLLKLGPAPHVTSLSRCFLATSAMALYAFLFGRRRKEAE